MKVRIKYERGGEFVVRDKVKTISIEDGCIKLLWDDGLNVFYTNRFRITQTDNEQITVEPI